MGIGRMTQPSFRAVFLDRDGVLNRAIVKNGKPFPPATLAELKLPEDAADALAELRAEGFLLLGITNQPDVARGTQSRGVVEAINRELLSALPLTDILVCYHDDHDSCSCRKPQPGLLLKAAARYRIELSASFMIGDRWRDVEAGHQAGCATVLLDHGYREKTSKYPPDCTALSLKQATAWIVSRTRRPKEHHDD